MRAYLFILPLVLFGLVIGNKAPVAQGRQQQAAPVKTEAQIKKGSVPDIKNIQVLDLDMAQHIALADNPTLAAALERVRQARQRVLQAGAAYWPSLDANASAMHVRLSDSSYQASLASARLFDPQAGVADQEDYYNAGVTAGWVLFNGFERKFLNAAARYGEQESVAACDEARRLMLSWVAISYHNAQLARENIIIAKSDEAFFQRQLDEARARRRMGTGSLSDELNFKIRINNAKAALIEKKKLYDVTMFGLAALLGIPEAVFPLRVELAELEDVTETELALPDPQSMIEYALAHRPDIRQGDYFVKKAGAGVGAARAGFFPSVVLSANLEGDRSGDADFRQEDFGNSVGVSLFYNLFAGGLNRAKLSEARAMETEAVKNLENLIIKVVSEVRQSVVRLRSAQDQLSLQRANALLARQNRDLVEKEYAVGQGSLVRLNEAQRDLTTAESRLAQALVALRQARHNLDTDTGYILVRIHP